VRRRGRRRRRISMLTLSQTDWVVAYAAWAAAAAAIVYTFLTVWLSWETRQARLAQSVPNVVVRVVHDRDRETVLCIVIENIGHGVAFDVKFILSRDIPQIANGIAIADATESPKEFVKMTKGPLISGIPLLCPGDRRVITWGQFGGLTSVLGGSPVEVVAKYMDRRGVLSRTLRSTSYLEVESFSWTDASATATTVVSRSLRKIADEVSKISLGNSKVRVVVQTVEEEKLQSEKDRQNWIGSNPDSQETSAD
jgi:hypothetical protein